MPAANADVRRASAFLSERGISSISPRRLATAAQELGKTFAAVLELIMTLRSGGQGQGPAPIAERIAKAQAE